MCQQIVLAAMNALWQEAGLPAGSYGLYGGLPLNTAMTSPCLNSGPPSEAQMLAGAAESQASYIRDLTRMMMQTRPDHPFEYVLTLLRRKAHSYMLLGQQWMETADERARRAEELRRGAAQADEAIRARRASEALRARLEEEASSSTTPAAPRAAESALPSPRVRDRDARDDAPVERATGCGACALVSGRAARGRRGYGPGLRGRRRGRRRGGVDVEQRRPPRRRRHLRGRNGHRRRPYAWRLNRWRRRDGPSGRSATCWPASQAAEPQGPSCRFCVPEQEEDGRRARPRQAAPKVRRGRGQPVGWPRRCSCPSSE